MAGTKGQFMFRIQSYTAALRKIQWSSGTILGAALLITSVIPGCSSMPLASNDIDSPTILTGSIPSNTDVAYADVDERDREILALTLDSASVDPNDQVTPVQTLAWTNPESGNSGTISNVDLTKLPDTGCVEFDTTANTIAGIKIYHGTACRDITQRMVITALAANNA